MNLKPVKVTYGELNCIQIDGSDSPDTLVVTMHGFGAPGDDLVPICQEWVTMLEEVSERVRFVFPAAPLTLESMGMPRGRAWWLLNMSRLMQAVEARDITELRGHEPPGLTEAREMLVTAIDSMMETLGITPRRLIMGGFSQGAMLAADTAMRGWDWAPAALFLYSGTLICESEWIANSIKLTQTQTVQSHGTTDAILPFEGAEALYALLKTAAVPVHFLPFEGPHTLSLEALDATAGMIRQIAIGRKHPNL